MKNKFGIIVSTRSFFPSHLVKTAREDIARVMAEMGYEYVMVGYLLKNTVSENGTVARGVC